ncbi:MAG: protease family protein [Verrucomicrobiota bacterium]|jgi:membrane protease YdiL (CAAX protease family)
MSMNNPSPIRRLFAGNDGVHPIWRFLAFALGIFLFGLMVEDPLLLFLATKLQLNIALLSPQLLLLEEILSFIGVVIVTGVFAALERRRIDGYGLPVDCAFRGKFWEGVVLGLLGVAFVAIGMLLTGGMEFHGIALHGPELFLFAFLWLMTMLLVGLNEEYLFRGYALQTLTRGIGFWPAALVTSSLFAGLHLSKPHENAIDIGIIFVLGLLMCFTLLRTGSLWLAVGWHAAFDFGQFFIVGTKNGGEIPVGRLFDVTFPGPAWSNGGELGTEASLFMIPVIIASFIYIDRRYRGPISR